MGSDPAILFYTSDFLIGTEYFTEAEAGQYIRFLCRQHQHGPLSEDLIKRFFPQGIFQEVLKKMIKDQHGNIYNKRMHMEIEKRKTYSESRRQNGMKKYSKNDKPLSNKTLKPSAYAPRMQVHMEDENEDENRDAIKDEKFLEFWKLYPKKTGKGAAEKAWDKIAAPSETLEKIKLALEWQKQSEQWKKENGQFIPMPATYLNQRRWEDESCSKPPKKPKDQRYHDQFRVDEAKRDEYRKRDEEIPEELLYPDWEKEYK